VDVVGVSGRSGVRRQRAAGHTCPVQPRVKVSLRGCGGREQTEWGEETEGCWAHMPVQPRMKVSLRGCGGREQTD